MKIICYFSKEKPVFNFFIWPIDGTRSHFLRPIIKNDPTKLRQGASERDENQKHF